MSKYGIDEIKPQITQITQITRMAQIGKFCGLYGKTII
jgi:hypothetical protein